MDNELQERARIARPALTSQRPPPPDKTMAHPILSKHTSRTHSLLHSQRNVTDGTQNRLWWACRATLVCHRLGKGGEK
ncbi:MAG: hypothetical protein E7122_04790 [Bacteroidales bacterium]|nr:hypothetical protein [Bacteroidales bacterium]